MKRWRKSPTLAAALAFLLSCVVALDLAQRFQSDGSKWPLLSRLGASAR